MNVEPVVRRDAWEGLRRYTPARVALGRAGGSVKTSELLDFRLAHARARDAVHEVFDAEAVCNELAEVGLKSLKLATRARDREEYLREPDRGRRLSDDSRALLVEAGQGAKPDVVIAVADGLSALAIKRQALQVIRELVPRANKNGWSIGPVGVVSLGRVAVQDEIGELLGARAAVMLIGERPGLGTADSLGAYMVFGPRVGRTDAERNCISNIRAGGMGHAQAAERIDWVVRQMLHQEISGVALKLHGLLAQ